MRRRQAVWCLTAAVVTGFITLGLSAVLAQNAAPKGASGKGGRAKVGVPKKVAPNAADPLENPAVDPLDKLAPPGLVHYRLKVRASDGSGPVLAMTYYPVYPARIGINAPVLLMIHQKDRSGRDFEDPIKELKDQGLAEHMQSLGYAVLVMDLRGHGLTGRKALTTQDWQAMVEDLQVAYQFLVDRHNRGKLNLAKLGVLAVGEGANLAAAWAHQPGGGVSSEGRTSDISAMVLVSPLADGEGILLKDVMLSVGPRIPLLLMVGARDVVSADPVRAVRPLVERVRQNRVEIFDSSLHGYKLLRLEPRAPSVVARFFEGTVKFKNNEWEPRYNLTPVAYGDIELVRGGKLPPPAAGQGKAKDAGQIKKVPK
jgi:hypothetical protein